MSEPSLKVQHYKNLCVQQDLQCGNFVSDNILKTEPSNYKTQRKGTTPSHDIKETNMNLGGYKQKILKLESD